MERLGVLLLALAARAGSEPARPAQQDLTDEIVWAVRSGNLVAVDRWIDGGRSVRLLDESTGHRLLHAAADAGQLAVVLRLLDAGCEPQVRTTSGWTALAIACERGDTVIVEALLDRGSSVDGEPAPSVVTPYLAPPPPPLVLAADAGHVAVVRALLERGAKLDAQDELGRSALFHAAMHGHDDVLRALLDERDARSAWIDAPDHRGWTPLHAAAAFGRSGSAALLVAGGADAAARSAGGFPPAELAALFGHAAVEELLRAAPARAPAPVAPNGRTDASTESDVLRALAADAAGDPIFALVHRSGYPGPVMLPRGIVLAIWPDGALLRSADRAQPGEEVLLGRVGEPELHRALVLLEEIGLTRLTPTNFAAMHDADDSFYFDRAGERVCHAWTPGRRFRSDTPYADRFFQRRQLLAAVVLVEQVLSPFLSHPAERLEPHLVDGEFRGYVEAQPFSTPWMHGR